MAQNRINNKIYIGKTIYSLQFRINAHKSRGRQPFGNALKKYGEENFIFSVIDNACSEEELAIKEAFWIEFYNCKSPNGYNLTDGGEGSSGLKHKPETKQKISELAKGRRMPPRSKEHRDKLSKLYKGKPGRKWTDEQKTKLSETMKKRPPAKESTRQKLSMALKGRKFSEQTIKRMSEAAKNKIISKETRAKMSKAQTGRRHKQETKNKISDSNRRRVYSEETKNKIRDKLKLYWSKKTHEERKQIMAKVRG